MRLRRRLLRSESARNLMLISPRALSKGFATVRAGVWFLASVGALVGQHVGLLHEGLSAVRAGEALLARMNHLVTLQGRARRKFFAT